MWPAWHGCGSLLPGRSVAHIKLNRGNAAAWVAFSGRRLGLLTVECERCRDGSFSECCSCVCRSSGVFCFPVQHFTNQSFACACRSTGVLIFLCTMFFFYFKFCFSFCSTLGTCVLLSATAGFFYYVCRSRGAFL